MSDILTHHRAHHSLALASVCAAFQSSVFALQQAAEKMQEVNQAALSFSLVEDQ